MKIAVCGKGGCGKSTTTALLAKELARAGKKVLVIDSDESNYGLHRQLGMELPKDFTAFFGGKEAVLKDMMLSSFARQFFNGPWSLADIPEGYRGEKDGVMLMASGKIHKANGGCACAMNGRAEGRRRHSGRREGCRCWAGGNGADGDMSRCPGPGAGAGGRRHPVNASFDDIRGQAGSKNGGYIK